jgi:formylglycine-generating enzyme required for sulfatase activity
MKLCALDEWLNACKGASGNCTWAYTPAGGSCDDYESKGSTGCNGHDVTASSGSPDTDALSPTGSKPECYASFGSAQVFDLSGNAKEWTTGSGSPGSNPLRGGSFNNNPVGLGCDFDFTLGAADLRLPNIGFRCCSNTEP